MAKTQPKSPSLEEVWPRVGAALAEAGVDEEQLQAAAAEGFEGVARLVARYLTFPGARIYTAADVERKAGVDEETAQTLWRAMGFPEIPDDERAFTDADVEALQLATRLFRRAGVDGQLMLQQTRTTSQAAARIAFAHQDVIGNVADPTNLAGAATDAIELANETLPTLDRLLVYLYRRHLAAATEQSVQIATKATGAVEMTVGFADMSRFTNVSKELDTRQLADLIERFNGAAADVIAEGGGRVVKMIGDEVMFTALDAAAGASIALRLLEVVGPETGFPPLRIGLATGPVIAREGDVFGQTVNLANRLVVAARPGTIVVDAATREALASDPKFDIKRIPGRPLKGIGYVRPYRLRAA